MWWGKRRKRGSRLSRQLALGLLEDAMAQAEQQQDQGEPETVPYPQPSSPPPAGEPEPQHHELPVQRSGENTRHGTFG
jgi:hypothetical protein